MAYAVALRCRRCGKDFEFTAGEQEEFRLHRWPSPSLCASCRLEPREPMIEAICAACGQPALVRVCRADRTRIYCADCFDERTRARWGGGRAGDRLG